MVAFPYKGGNYSKAIERKEE
jgi:hypothetical protein